MHFLQYIISYDSKKASFSGNICINKDRQESGAVLIIILMLVSILATLTLSTLEMVLAGIQITANHKRDIQSLYVADAGVEDSIRQLRANPSWNSGFSNKAFGSGSYTVSINNSSYPNITINSAGTLNSFQKDLEVLTSIVQVDASNYLVKVLYWREI